MNENRCPFCSSLHIQYVFNTYDIWHQKWHVYYCNDCQYYFLNPFPTDEQLSKSYQTDYYGKGKKKFSFPFLDDFINYFNKSRAKKLISFINSKKDSSILDIGCGNGNFLKHLFKKGYQNLYGIELPGNSANRAAKKTYIRLYIGNIYSCSFTEQTFDAITIFHVFEHLQNPDQTIKLIDKWLKVEGILMISFPNICSRQARLFKGYWFHLDPPRHLNFISPNDFINKMKSLNYQIIEQHYFSIEQNPFGYVQSTLNLFHKKRELLFESFKGNWNYIGSSVFALSLHFLFFIITTPFFIFLDFIDSINKKSGTVLLILKKNKPCKRDVN